MLKLILVVGGLIVLLAVAAAVQQLLRKPSAKKPEPVDAETPTGPPPFNAKSCLMSDAEREFFHTLAAIARDRSVIFVQVPLNRLIDIKPGTDSRQSWWNKIDRKTVDFVLCDPKSLQVQAALELDDRSHKKESRKQRDADVEEWLRAAGVPLVRVQQHVAYNAAELESQIRSAVRSGVGSAAVVS